MTENYVIDVNKFAAFCAAKPEGETFNYLSNTDCALAQFLKSEYPRVPVEVSGYDVIINDHKIDIPESIFEAFNAARNVEDNGFRIVKRFSDVSKSLTKSLPAEANAS